MGNVKTKHAGENLSEQVNRHTVGMIRVGDLDLDIDLNRVTDRTDVTRG